MIEILSDDNKDVKDLKLKSKDLNLSLLMDGVISGALDFESIMSEINNSKSIDTSQISMNENKYSKKENQEIEFILGDVIEFDKAKNLNYLLEIELAKMDKIANNFENNRETQKLDDFIKKEGIDKTIIFDKNQLIEDDKNNFLSKDIIQKESIKENENQLDLRSIKNIESDLKSDFSKRKNDFQNVIHRQKLELKETLTEEHVFNNEDINIKNIDKNNYGLNNIQSNIENKNYSEKKAIEINNLSSSFYLKENKSDIKSEFNNKEKDYKSQKRNEFMKIFEKSILNEIKNEILQMDSKFEFKVLEKRSISKNENIFFNNELKSSKAQIEIKDTNLGKINIELNLKNDELDVKLKLDNYEAAKNIELLKKEIEEIINRNCGVKKTDIFISYNNEGSKNNSNKFNQKILKNKKNIRVEEKNILNLETNSKVSLYA